MRGWLPTAANLPTRESWWISRPCRTWQRVKRGLGDRRQKPIVCPTSDLTRVATRHARVRAPIVRRRRRSGSEKTCSVFPYAEYFTSPASTAGTMRGLPPPSPVGTAMYCRPPTAKVSGKHARKFPSASAGVSRRSSHPRRETYGSCRPRTRRRPRSKAPRS
jgi:hypothetical protein